MSTACGRPQGEGFKLIWTHMDRERVKNPDFLVNVINGWLVHIRDLRPMLDFKTASNIATFIVHPKLNY